MSMILTFNIQGAEPYRDVNGGTAVSPTLDEVIDAESYNVMSEANADHLEDNTDECREEFRQQVVREATAALRGPGDTYRDPIGVVWTLSEMRERDWLDD
jgi:hypothetical protein